MFGQPGEKTYGVDFLDLSGIQSVHAAAFKSTKDKGRVLGRSEIDKTVEQARNFQTRRDRFPQAEPF